MRVELLPGGYVAIGFVPDTGDGNRHAEHGIVLPFQVSWRPNDASTLQPGSAVAPWIGATSPPPASSSCQRV